MSQPIQPLRIQKNTPATSPSKMGASSAQRPLTELGPMERRRNSPSYVQTSKKTALSRESSPFDPSPFASNSPRLYWQSRDVASPNRFNTENRSPTDQIEGSLSPAKRSSIENLKRASRVKNSNMFAWEQKQEYDPSSSPIIERPLATGRPLSIQAQGNAYGGRGLDGLRRDQKSENKKIPLYNLPKSPTKTSHDPDISKTPRTTQVSPTKSSLSSKSRYAQVPIFDPENGNWTEEEDEDAKADHQLPPGKSLHRHAKSVTFDAAPPQINEYEMTTPDPSSIASGSREGSYESADGEDDSFDRSTSIERDESFDESLEDTDKTPVVLPEDWRFMSPSSANHDLAAHVENPFTGKENSPSPTARPCSAIGTRLSPTRTDSANSNGERRPLPPLPAMEIPMLPRKRSNSANSLTATAERVSSAQRMINIPHRPASISKSDIHDMAGCSMSLEERLRLMMAQDDDKPTKSSVGHPEGFPLPDPQNESRDYCVKGEEPRIKIHEDETEKDDGAGLGDYKLPPRISRESILRKVKGQRQLLNKDEYDDTSPALDTGANKTRMDCFDPDVPLPSLEDDHQLDDNEVDIAIKQEDEEDSVVDVYSIPELYSQQHETESFLDSVDGHQAFEEALSHLSNHEDDDDDDASRYSEDTKAEAQAVICSSEISAEDDGPPTPQPIADINTETTLRDSDDHRMSLPQFASTLDEQSFDFGLESFLTPSPPLVEEPVKVAHPSKREEGLLERPVTPEAQLEPPRFPGQFDDSADEPHTPDSVIRHPIAESPVPDSPGVPEPVATIKAPGTKLKTRPSITPADIRVMAETRRQVSGELSKVPSEENSPDRPSPISDPEGFMLEQEKEPTPTDGVSSGGVDSSNQPKRKSSLVQLEIPLGKTDDGLGIGLNREFDRVIEAQKKGYLMRQNTKVVVASSASLESGVDSAGDFEGIPRGTRSAGNSPRKSGQMQPWTTEPWNGKTRRKSLRQSGGSPQKKPVAGPAPPLPGQQSNIANGLDSVTEDESMLAAEELDDGGERGVLFVKVVQVKDLDLPLPKGERSYFALTLDNGLHCVTTAWLELGKTAPIGQEFELLVLNDLEFQLTLQTKLEEPKVTVVPESPTKQVKTPKPSTFSRVFASPRKRKELEMKQQEEAQKAERQKQQEAHASRRAIQPTAWDLLHGLVAKDGSFARSYICLKDHESKAYGRPLTVDVPCFNEWATEEAQTISSVKSKKSTTRGGMQRKAPYRIGKLELQLLFIPKPKGSKDEDMPKSMNACIRELKEAETATPKKWEGHLSQQGGDCPYWRRRYFTLEGSKFTAHHEATRQPRATIHLAGASKLIDDKSALMRKETSSKGGGRRRSAFAEEEEGYMFVEEGFRIRFANGETIDFYADSTAEKDGWMKALSEVVGKEPAKVKAWTDLVLSRQRAASSNSSRAIGATDANNKAHSTRAAPPATFPQTVHPGFAPPLAHRDSRHSAIGHRRADPAKTKSMIF